MVEPPAIKIQLLLNLHWIVSANFQDSVFSVSAFALEVDLDEKLAHVAAFAVIVDAEALDVVAAADFVESHSAAAAAAAVAATDIVDD